MKQHRLVQVPEVRYCNGCWYNTTSREGKCPYNMYGGRLACSNPDTIWTLQPVDPEEDDIKIGGTCPD